MKKLISTIAAVTLLGLGLGTTAGSAVAAPYPHTVPTETQNRTPSIERGERVTTEVRVTSDNSNRNPQGGRIRITWEKRNGERSTTRSFDYDGGWQTFRGPRLYAAGNWVAIAKYVPGDNSIFKASSDRNPFDVTR